MGSLTGEHGRFRVSSLTDISDATSIPGTMFGRVEANDQLTLLLALHSVSALRVALADLRLYASGS